MDHTEAIHRGLDGSKPKKTHVHRVEYERADNGGFHAKVHVHHAEAPHEHVHTVHHVLPNAEAAADHLQEHMGDQPAAGEAPDDGTGGAEPEPEAAGMAGGAAGGPTPGM